MKSLQDMKLRIQNVEESLSEAKRGYSSSLRNLERISDAIHAHRDAHALGERGSGVGAEEPPPATMDGEASRVTSQDADANVSKVKAASRGSDCGKTETRPTREQTKDKARAAFILVIY